MLEKAVAALKDDKAKALAMFDKGQQAASRISDLYVFCAGRLGRRLRHAHPYLKGELLQDIVGKKGFPLGKAIMETAAEGKIQSVTGTGGLAPEPRRRSRSTRSTRKSGARSAGRVLQAVGFRHVHALELIR